MVSRKMMHPDALEAMNDLAWSYENQGQWGMAVAMYDIVKARKAVLGERDPLTLTALANLGFAYWKEGRLDKAVALQELVLEERKVVLGEQHHLTLTAMRNLDDMRSDAQASIHS